MTIVLVLVGLVLLAIVAYVGAGAVFISKDEVGIIINNWGKDLPNGQLIAMKGEAGFQARTLPPGWHFGYWFFKYEVKKESVIVIEEGQIGLVVARDGSQIPQGYTSGKIVESNNFQDAEAFLNNGGNKGRQLGILTAGVYRINTALFEIVTPNSEQSVIDQKLLSVVNIDADKVGIVTVLEGLPLPEGRMAAPPIEDHKSFQDPDSFLKNKGNKGLQEDVLRSGIYTINPWFAKIEIVPMTEIPLGYVGVVISSSGATDDDISGVEFKHTNLVSRGNRGIWAEPLFPGKHPLNTKLLKLEMVPTTNIVLNWGKETTAHKYDENLNSVKARTKDAFEISLDVSQIIHVSATEAAKVISRVGSVKNLIDNILDPIIANYFRNSCQDADALSFVRSRTENQKKASEVIKKALDSYNVQAVDTLIGDLIVPSELMKTVTDRKIAEEQKETYDTQKKAQDQRKALVEATALAEAQTEVIKQEQAIKISEAKAKQNIAEANGNSEKIQIEAKANAESIKIRASAEAESIKKVGDARASAYTATALALGAKNLTAIEMVNKLAEHNVVLTPSVYAGGGEGGNAGGLFIAQLMGRLEDEKKNNEKPAASVTSPQEPEKKASK